MVYLGIPPTRDFNEKDVEVLAYNTNSMPSDKDTIKNKQNIAANISEKKKTSEGIAEVSSANEEQGNLMPSLIGLTMKEANDKLIDIGIDYDFKGNGYVVSQEPEPNSIIKENQKCFLVFNF
jgi:beta-lactam-binding protein with PASTA domain